MYDDHVALRNFGILVVGLTLVSLTFGFPSTVVAGAAKRLSGSATTPATKSSTNTLRAHAVKSLPANFPTHPLLTAPSVLPQAGSVTPSNNPRSQILADRLR